MSRYIVLEIGCIECSFEGSVRGLLRHAAHVRAQIVGIEGPYRHPQLTTDGYALKHRYQPKSML